MKLRWFIRDYGKEKQLQCLVPAIYEGEDGTWETVETVWEITELTRQGGAE